MGLRPVKHLIRFVGRPVARPAARGLGEPGEPAAPVAAPAAIGFRDLSRLRRRLRYLRQIRELAFRDLGGFVFEARRLHRPRGEIVEAKLIGLLAIDHELRALERALGEPPGVTLLLEPGITVCRGCGSIHASDDKFCAGCAQPVGSPGPEPLPASASASASASSVDQLTVRMPPVAGRGRGSGRDRDRAQ